MCAAAFDSTGRREGFLLRRMSRRSQLKRRSVSRTAIPQERTDAHVSNDDNRSNDRDPLCGPVKEQGAGDGGPRRQNARRDDRNDPSTR